MVTNELKCKRKHRIQECNTYSFYLIFFCYEKSSYILNNAFKINVIVGKNIMIPKI